MIMNELIHFMPLKLFKSSFNQTLNNQTLKRVNFKFAFSALFLIILSGCSEPWVKPYERQNLADPILSFSRHPLSDNLMHHVYSSREGARGAEGAGGGGCGCN